MVLRKITSDNSLKLISKIKQIKAGDIKPKKLKKYLLSS